MINQDNKGAEPHPSPSPHRRGDNGYELPARQVTISNKNGG